VKLALIQMTSVLDSKANLKKIEGWLTEARGLGARAVFLPECFYSMSNGLKPSTDLIDENDQNCPHEKALRDLVQKTGIAIIGGSAATKSSKGILNRTYSFDQSGKKLPAYDKRKLFACRLSEKSITESDIYTAGSTPQVLEFEELKIGLGICFDIRFSSLAHDYRLAGVNLLTYASAFTVPTGKAHWHLLNRARAVENQCFVISSAQVGQHNERLSTYGHSLVVDPWGDVLVDAGDEEGCFVFEIDLARVEKVRNSVLMG